jgi:hypothetical protein
LAFRVKPCMLLRLPMHGVIMSVRRLISPLHPQSCVVRGCILSIAYSNC